MSESFDWDTPGLDGPRFRALVNLLTMRNGGQLDTPEFEDRDKVDLTEEDDAINEAATDRPEEISDSGHDGLKRKCLDKLAEVVSRSRIDLESRYNPVMKTSKQNNQTTSSDLNPSESLLLALVYESLKIALRFT